MTDSPAVLVAGGAGYVGIHTVAALAARGRRVVVLDNLEHGHAEWVRDLGCGLVVADIADRATVLATCRAHGIGSMMHFAAYAYVGESVTDPLRYWRNNVEGSLALLEVCAELDIDHFVFSSTCATYGVPEATPITESAPQRPVNPYGRTKLAVEQMLDDLGTARPQFRSVALRYFNAAGADPNGRFGESHDPETHLIPLLLAAAAGDRDGFRILGDDYPTPDGTCVRDFVHVADLADAHCRALEHLESHGESLRLNLSTGQGHSVREVIDAVERVTDSRITAQVAARRPGDPPVLVGDPAAANRALGWQPTHVELDDIIRHAWHWYQQQRSRR